MTGIKLRATESSSAKPNLQKEDLCLGVSSLAEDALEWRAPLRVRAKQSCDSDFQIVDGMSVFTPYYQNESLAVEASGAEVRPHPEIKREACLLAAPTDEATCAAYTSD